MTLFGLVLVLGLRLGPAGAPEAQSRFAQAQALEREGRLRDAVAVLEADDSRDLESGSLLAWLYARTERPELAIEEYRRLLGSFPGTADLHNNLGALLYRRRRLDEAEAQFEAARSLAPHSASPSFNLGLVLFDKGEHLAAAAALRRAAELAPGRASYHFTLARALRAAFQFEPAAGALRAGLALDAPEELARRGRLELALTLKQLGRFREAESELVTLAGGASDDAEAHFQLGRLRMAMNRQEDASRDFRRVVEVNPRHGPALFMLGLSAYQQNRPEEALASFRRLLDVEPKHAEGAYRVGLILQGEGDEEGAKRMFEHALRLEPDHLGANYNLALSLAKLGASDASAGRFRRFQELSEKRERLDYLEERVRIDPHDARFFFELGQEYVRQGRANDALASFQRALELDPNLAAAELAITEIASRSVP